MYKQISPKEIKGNLIDKISNEWMLITAGDADAHNMMTASWGFMGEMWGNDTAMVVVRPQRYTMEFIQRKDYFSISFYGNNKDVHKICGSKSGRDIDKTKECGLTAIFDKAPYFEEAELVLICKKQYVQQMKEDCFTDKTPIENWYPNKDLHYMIFGKIEKVLIKE